MGTCLMTSEAARRIAKAHPGSGFARRSARVSHSNSQRDAQSQAVRDREMQAQNREDEASSGHGSTQDQASAHDGQEQAAGVEQCPYCTLETLCARHANRWPSS